jgi:peptidoglycan/xylan/chitin deacetylase (PgdA/CDA1 family)
MATKSCKNHPEKNARHRCYQCKSYICTSCRIKLDRHFFCGYKCFIQYKILQLPKLLKNPRFRSLSFNYLLLFIILIQFLYLLHRVNQNPPVRLDTTVQDTLSLRQISDYLKNYQQDATPGEAENINQNKNYYAFDLELGKNSILNIWRNKIPVHPEVIKSAEKNSFRIPLEYGKNDLRILTLDESQNPVYSNRVNVYYRNERVELLRRSVERAYPEQKKVALTFDAGSDDAHTLEILAILKQFNLHCTLFLTGNFMQKHKDLVRQMVEDGHEIANHTFTHPHLTTYTENYNHLTRAEVDRPFLQNELVKTDSLFFQISGKHLKPYWRAPYGEYNPEILTWAAEVGYLHIRWTTDFDTYDWVVDESSKLYRTPEQVYEHFISVDDEHPNGLNGVIVLMHLGSHRNGNHVFEALPKLIETIRARGYEVGSISDLLI